MSLTSIPHLGELCAITTAVVWTFSVILFKKSGEAVHPIALNLFKNVLAAALIVPTIYVMGDELLRDVPREQYWMLLASGALGIGVADTLFFMSLNLLGAGLSAIVDCFYSPSVIGLSMLWLGEKLSVWQVVGAALIVSAIVVATTGKRRSDLPRGHLVQGVVLGALSMFTMAVGVVMIKRLLEVSPLLWVSEVRLIGGILILAVVLLFHRQRKPIVMSLTGAGHRIYTVSGSFLGAYVALLLWLAGFKFAQASVVAALNQTSNIMVFVAAAIFLHEPITKQRMAGIGFAVVGAYLVTFG
jgi:drug/metabolite transporter (DMT)-like permease